MDNNELLSQIKSLMAEQTEQLQKQMDERFAEQDQRIERRFAEQDQRIEKRFAEQDQRIEKRFTEQDLRIERLEKHVQQIDEKMEAQRKEQRRELIDMMETQRKEQRRELIDMMETQTQKLSIIIENGISKRIDALFDARDISLAKDKELEDRTQALEKKVDDVQNRVTVLESKTASAT